MAEPPAVIPAPATDSLAEALPILQAKYVDFKALNYKQGDHLGDLIARSAGKINLVGPGVTSTSLPILTVNLPGNIIYWRLASFTPQKRWTDLATQLAQAGSSATGIILDLRSNTAPDDFHGAAQVMGFLFPKDPTLSKYDTSGLDHGAGLTDHPIQVPVIVLTNNQTKGAAEFLAACLKADGALVIGRKTAGKAAAFEEQKLASGQILRYAVADVALADGLPLWGHPVSPDVELTVDDRSEKGALVLIKDNQILDLIQESAERHRMSEAALVKGQDPEWDDYLASLEQKDTHFLLSLPPIHDVVLVAALDSIKAIQVSQRPMPAPPPTEAAPQVSSAIP